MNKKQQENMRRLYVALGDYGISMTDVAALRRIEMVLHRWAEKECGIDTPHGSYVIERDEKTGKPFGRFYSHATNNRYPVPDAETGALRRLAAVMERYPDLCAYHQTDPRGCALYILRKADVGSDRIDRVYARGVAVCV